MIIDKTDFLYGINLNTDESPKMYSTNKIFSEYFLEKL